MLKQLRKNNFWVCAVVAWGISCSTAPTTSYAPSTPQYRITLDRVVLSVRDVSVAKQRFEKDLGFNMPGLVIPLANGSSIELTESSDHEGINVVQISTTDLNGIAEKAQAHGVPFEQTKLRDKDGKNYARVLSFKNYEPLKLFSFIQYKDNYSPTAEFYSLHRNSAQKLQEVWIVVDNWYEMEAELSKIGFEYSDSRILQPLRVNAKSLSFSEGELVFVQRGHLEARDKTHLQNDGNEVIGASISVDHIEVLAKTLEGQQRVQFATTRYSGKSCILIPPRYTYGMWLELARE